MTESFPICYFTTGQDCTGLALDYSGGQTRSFVAMEKSLSVLEGPNNRGAFKLGRSEIELTAGGDQAYEFYDGLNGVVWDGFTSAYLAFDGGSILHMVPAADSVGADGAWSVSLLAGLADSAGESRDGRGTEARFSAVTNMACDQRGAAYVAGGALIRKVQLPESLRCSRRGGEGPAAQPPSAAAAAVPAAAGEAEVTTLQMEGWPAASNIFGVRHVPAGSAWGPAECLIFTTRTAVYRLPLRPTGASGADGVAGGAAGGGPQLVAGQEGEEDRPYVDGQGGQACFSCIRTGITMDGDGQLLLLDTHSSSDTTRLRVVAACGTVTTVAGISLQGVWCHPLLLPNGYLAVHNYVPEESDDSGDEAEAPSLISDCIAVIATSFAPARPAAATGLPTAGPPPRSLPGDLGALLEDAQQPGSRGGGGGGADLTIRVSERCFHAHRAILSARCDYFKQRLAGDAFADGRAADLELPDADPDAFALLLHWLYTGGADIPPEQARGVAELADRLLLPDLCSMAQDVLAANLSTASIVDSLLWAAGCCESRGGSFTQVMARLKRWYVERAAEVRREARDSLRHLMTQQPDLMLELMEASEQRAVKRARLN